MVPRPRSQRFALAMLLGAIRAGALAAVLLGLRLLIDSAGQDRLVWGDWVAGVAVLALAALVWVGSGVLYRRHQWRRGGGDDFDDPDDGPDEDLPSDPFRSTERPRETIHA